MTADTCLLDTLGLLSCLPLLNLFVSLDTDSECKFHGLLFLVWLVQQTFSTVFLSILKLALVLNYWTSAKLYIEVENLIYKTVILSKL